MRYFLSFRWFDGAFITFRKIVSDEHRQPERHHLCDVSICRFPQLWGKQSSYSVLKWSTWKIEKDRNIFLYVWSRDEQFWLEGRKFLNFSEMQALNFFFSWKTQHLSYAKSYMLLLFLQLPHIIDFSGFFLLNLGCYAILPLIPVLRGCAPHWPSVGLFIGEDITPSEQEALLTCDC